MDKILRFPLSRIFLALLFVVGGLLAGQAGLNLSRSAFSITDAGVANLLAFALIVPALYYAYSWYVRAIEKRLPTELGFSLFAGELASGFSIGLGLFGAVIAILWLLGYYHVDGLNPIWLALIGMLAGALASAFAQELIFRAILFRLTEEWLGTRWALAISALLFGLIHLTSAGATILSAMAIALQAGILLGAAYALTHRIWLALGIHAAWDFANDGIFGVGVAGQSGQAITGLLKAHLQGPGLVTGGALGVEASLVALVVTLVAGLLLLSKSMRRDRIEKSQPATTA